MIPVVAAKQEKRKRKLEYIEPAPARDAMHEQLDWLVDHAGDAKACENPNCRECARLTIVGRILLRAFSD